MSAREQEIFQKMLAALKAIATAEIFDPMASAVAMQTMVRSILNNIAAAEAAQAQQPADGVVLDAERYRLLRRGQHWSVIDGLGDVLWGNDLDEALDAALAAHKAQEGGK